MSTKKKVGISDLLRDEAQKGTEASNSEVSNQAVATSASNPRIDDKTVDKQTIEIKAETITELPSQVNSLAAQNGSKATKLEDAALTTALSNITALETALAASNNREAEMTKAIAELQKELQFSKTNVELLQKSLTAIETLKNELEQQLVDVKRDNLRLAETNIQLSEQITSLESQPTAKVESTQLAVQPAPNNRATPRKQPVEQPYPQRDRTPYARPTGSNEQLQRINNKNIGWMD